MLKKKEGGGAAARRCQAQANVEKRVAAAPTSRRLPINIRIVDRPPKSHLALWSGPAKPLPDTDSSLSAARVTDQPTDRPSTRSCDCDCDCDCRPSSSPPSSSCPLLGCSQHQLLLIRPACSHRRTATPLRTGPEPIGRRSPKTAEKYETSRCRCVSASSAGGGRDHWAVEDQHPILRKPTAPERVRSTHPHAPTRTRTPSPTIPTERARGTYLRR